MARGRTLRKDRTGASPLVVGAVVLLVIAALTYLGFTKDIPFSRGFQMKAVFETANSVRVNSPVRVAGVNVGKVKKIERYEDSDFSVITMEINDAGLPVHEDATLKIRPRIFLEGNFFIDLQPGTPSSETIDDGDTINVTQTSAPVQLGDVLTSLQSDDRQNLQKLINEFGRTLTREPTAADDRLNDPDTEGETAAESLNDASRTAAPALRDLSIVNEAFLGREPHDLSGLVRSLSRVTGALGRNDEVLKDFVTNFNLTMQIFANESENLRATVRDLAPTLESANRTFASLNAAFPPVRAFAREILPGVRETPATIDASFPWIRQTRGLLRKTELRGLAEELSPATRDLAAAINGTFTLLPEQDLLAQCLSKVILPTGDIRIQDGPLSTGVENYKEFWYTMAGLAGESQNFDGNGSYVRFQPGGGTQTVSTGASSLSGDQLFGRTPEKPLGTRPAYPGVRPPYRPDVPCHTQTIPDLNSARTGPPDNSTGPAGNSGAGVPIVGEGTSVTTGFSLPTGTTTPTLPRAQRKAAAPAQKSLSAELLDRLNPFAQGGEGK